MISVGICTDTIEIPVLEKHDHPYSKITSPPRSPPPKIATQLESPLESVHAEIVEPLEIEEYFEEKNDDDDDTDFHLSPDSSLSSSLSSSMCSESLVSETSPQQDEKFIAFKLQLNKLFTVCHMDGCGSPIIDGPHYRQVGFAAIITTECVDGHTYVWETQPKIGKMHAGNLLIPSTIFLTGGSYAEFSEICSTVNISALSVRQCTNIQAAYIVPEVTSMWTTHSEAVLSAMSGDDRTVR